MTMGPLDGVRVIDQTTVVVGPICARTLGDYGADVIKVESPSGDLLRTMAQGSRNVGMSGKFLNFNRNKRSVCLDIKKKEGLRALKKLIQTADVFVSNVRPQGLMRAGLDYEALSADNPRLIYCSIVGFGKGGRYYNRPGYDPIIQSVSGVAATLHRATGEPRFVPMVMTDHTTGLIAAQAIGFALFRREKTGVGDPRFSCAAARTKLAEEYFQIRIEGLSLKTTSEWLDIFEKVDVPCQRYNTIEDLIDDPHLEDVGFFLEKTHPSEGLIRKTRTPNTFSGGGRQDGCLLYTSPSPRDRG